MAIDDVISDYETSVSSASHISIQPASGDEWLVTQFVLQNTTWEVNPHTDSGNTNIGIWGGDTSATTVLDELGLHPVTFLVTNSEYVRLGNYSPGTATGGFSAIKTKD